MENLRSALQEALEMNRSEARLAAGDKFEEVRIEGAGEFFGDGFADGHGAVLRMRR